MHQSRRPPRRSWSRSTTPPRRRRPRRVGPRAGSTADEVVPGRRDRALRRRRRRSRARWPTGWPAWTPRPRSPAGRAGRGPGDLRRPRPRASPRPGGSTSTRSSTGTAAREYVAAFCGFAPGFAYLAGLADGAAPVPRLATPRTRVPAGSVGAGRARGAGSTRRPRRAAGSSSAPPTPCCGTPTATEPALLAPGTRVRFVPR